MVNGHREPDVRTPSLADALIPLITLAVLIAGALALFGLDALGGPIQVALMLCCAEAALIGVAPTNLSWLAADSGTVTPPLVPWSSYGAFMGATLGVSTLLYLPYAVFCYASPALSVLYGITGFKIERVEPTELQEDTA